MALIDRQVAIDALDEQIKQCNKALGSFGISEKDEYAIKVERASLKAYRERLENLPTVQSNHNAEVSKMEIIHCKDCKFAHMTVGGECKYCDIWFPDEKTYMPGDYYCGSAERRGESDGRTLFWKR